jgi:putative sigma-54 modulation protein
MNISVRGKNIEVTPALKDYAEKRIGKLGKYLGHEVDAVVVLSVARDDQTVEVTMPFNGMILRGEESTADMYSSIDMVVEKLEKQIERFKGKVLGRTKRDRCCSGKEVGAQQGSPTYEPKIVKTKRFAIKPMHVDEAVLQMNLLGHNFFFFFNAETEQTSVVYKRNDGNYGLIEQEFE